MSLAITALESDSLRQRVWPSLDRWKNVHLGKGSDVDIDQDIAAGGFLSLLDRLRDVFLQVSVIPMLTSTALKLRWTTWVRVTSR